MIDFDLTDEHALLERTVREWAAREVAPHIQELDREHRFDRRFLTQMADLGLLGVCVPAAYGGAGMDYLCLGLASEELEYPVGRVYRNPKGAVIYEGTREIHKLMQADYLLGYRTDRPTRCELPPCTGATARG